MYLSRVASVILIFHTSLVNAQRGATVVNSQAVAQLDLLLVAIPPNNTLKVS